MKIAITLLKGEKVKKIILHGSEVLVPSTVRFMATDSSGDIWAYDNEPDMCVQSWAPSGHQKGNMYFVGNHPENNWQSTLQKI